MKKSHNPILIFLFFGLFGFPVFPADVTIEQVTEGAEVLQQVEQEFARLSAPGRLSILCLGHFADEQQKRSFCLLPLDTVGQLEKIIIEQEVLQKKMEDYTGRDWEDLYGRTQIWSTCSRTVQTGRFLLTRNRFWQALSEDSEKKQILNSVIETCASEGAGWRGQEQILQVLALWQRGEPSDDERLRVILHQMMLRSDLTEQARDRMLLLQRRFELFSEGPFVEELEGLFRKKLEEQEDFEWALEYAFLEFADSDSKPLEQVVKAWPQSEAFVSLLLLEACRDQYDRTGRAAVSKWSPFVITRVCHAVMESGHPEKYRLPVAELARLRETPVVMRAMAETLVSSEPEKAMEYYLKAIRQQPADSDSSDIEIAEGAARLGCRLYPEDAGRYGEPAMQALRRYLEIAGRKADPEIQYAAVRIFAEQGQEAESRRLLAQLAESGGEPAVRAQMEMYRISRQQTKDPQERKRIEENWEGWIQSLDQEPMAELRRQAAIEYVQVLFAVPSREHAEKIAAFLEVEPREGDPTLTYLYVQALALLDRYGQALTAIGTIPIDCRNRAFELFVLEGFMDRLEEYTFQAGKPLEAEAFQKAGQVRSCFESPGPEKDRADLVWAELTARRAAANQAGREIDAILDRFEQSPRVETIRCRAFRRMQRGQWGEAVGDWQAVRSAYEPEDRTEKRRDWHWWRAKYYELLCYSRLPQDMAEDVAHAVEILKVLYEPPAACWEVRLKDLTIERGQIQNISKM